MRQKFRILYPKDHPEEDKRGTRYKPPEIHMVVMNGGGCFFLVGMEAYYPSVQKLSDVLPKYDVVWN